MRKLIIIVVVLFSVIYSARGEAFAGGKQDSLTFFSTSDLYSVTTALSAEYNRSNPGAGIRIVKTDPAHANQLIGKGLTGFAGNTSMFIKAANWKMVIGRDVIVPVINTSNPLREEIIKTGVSPERLSSYLKGESEKTWGLLLGNNNASKALIYSLDDKVIEYGIREYTGSAGIQAGSLITKQNPAELMAAISSDPLAIAFCRLADISGTAGVELSQVISLLPLDRNDDGAIDHNENIYSDLNTFTRGVWIGKYPAALVNGIYSVSSEQPSDAATIAFLKWIIGRGQSYMQSEGYTALLSNERLSGAEKLAAATVPGITQPETASIFRTLLLMFIVISVAVSLVVLARRLLRKKAAEPAVSRVHKNVLDEKAVLLPGGILYDKTHTWAFMEQDGLVKVGVDDFMHHVTGSIGKIRMKKEGESVKRGEEIFSLVKNGKQLHLYAPVSGTIKRRNSGLESDAAVLNASPYTEGWIYMIEPLNWSRESPLLMMADKHRQFIKEELTKLRDFLAEVFAAKNPELGSIILQDGGSLFDSPLEDMSPEVWEEFQTKFIDPSRQVWFYELF